MGKRIPFANLSGSLRARAREKSAAKGTPAADQMSPEDVQRLLEELRIHQIELEMQNEDLNRAQEELDASRERYFQLYDLAPVGYLTLNDKGLILEANLTAAKLLGVAKAGMVQKPFSVFVSADDQDVLYLGLKQVFAGAAPQVRELRLVRKDGAPFWARLEAAPLASADGASACRAVISDIDERKHAESEKKLETEFRQLQKAESLGRMAGAIAHHFNNHLMAVTGNLELAIGDLNRDAQCFDNLTQALQAARAAAELSTLMLTYVGQTTGKHEPVDLSEVCVRCLPLLRAAMMHDVPLETICPPPAPVVNANANDIQRVLINLVFNAWEARREGHSAINVTVKTVSTADIPKRYRFPVDWRPDDYIYACLQVADEGCGIASKDIDQLFDPFFSSKSMGRGLGLPVVLGIVRAHHGAVAVESEPGRGSTFRIFLPLAARGAPHRPDRATKGAAGDGSGTVLVVEDEVMVRGIVATMLRREGYAVLEASDGVEAMEVLRDHQDEIRCILCDLTMPRMNGWQTLAAVRKVAPDMPVVLASGYDETQAMAGDHPEWPQAFLGKPYRLRELREALGRALHQRPGISA